MLSEYKSPPFEAEYGEQDPNAIEMNRDEFLAIKDLTAEELKDPDTIESLRQSGITLKENGTVTINVDGEYKTMVTDPEDFGKILDTER